MITLNKKFLSNEIRALLMAEILEHEAECAKFSEEELRAIEHYHLHRLDDISLLTEYSNYFGA